MLGRTDWMHEAGEAWLLASRRRHHGEPSILKRILTTFSEISAYAVLSRKTYGPAS
jgi:hypothetical protein